MTKTSDDINVLKQVFEFIAAIGTALGLFVAGILFVAYHGPVPAWSLVVAGVVAIAATVIAYLIGLRRSPDDEKDGSGDALRSALASAERALAEATVSTNYLSNIDDLLTGMRKALVEVFSGAPPIDERIQQSALRQLELVRQLAFDAVIQGINGSRAEHIRCVFFKPEETSEGRTLVAEHHHGHSHDVAKLRLHADSRSVAGTAFATRQPVYIAKGASSDPRVEKVPLGKPMETLLCLPAFGPHSADPVGVFSVDSNQPEVFTLSDREFASVCASIFALVDFWTAILEAAEVEIQSQLEPASSEDAQESV